MYNRDDYDFPSGVSFDLSRSCKNPANDVTRSSGMFVCPG